MNSPKGLVSVASFLLGWEVETFHPLFFLKTIKIKLALISLKCQISSFVALTPISPFLISAPQYSVADTRRSILR